MLAQTGTLTGCCSECYDKFERWVTTSFIRTYVILFLINLVPGLSLRVPAEEEELGLDDAELGEFAYNYVELTRYASDIFYQYGYCPRQRRTQP